MVGITEISAALTGLSTAREMLRALSDVRDATKLNEVKIGLQSAILDAQQGLFAAQQREAADASRIADLEQEIVRLKDWSQEAARYELVSAGSVATAYMLKPDMRGAQAPHWLCTTCFHAGKKSILQPGEQGKDGKVRWNCAACRDGFAISFRRRPSYGDSE